MEKEQVVDYLDAVTKLSRELINSRDECVVLPEPAGEQIVDYLAISEKWKENKARMMRLTREDDE